MTAALALVPSGLALVPKVETSAEDWRERIIARLIDAELHEGNPHFAADYRQARITVVLIQKGDAIPFISASYEVHCCHPDQVFERVMQMRQAKLGREFPLWFDRNGILKPDVPIADYDPTCGLPPVLPSHAGSEGLHPFTAAPRKWPKAPARLVVSRTRVICDDVFFYEELLECGHTHLDYIGGWIGGNPKRRRRRCRECQKATEVQHPPIQAEANEKPYEMPTQHQPLRILPA